MCLIFSKKIHYNYTRIMHKFLKMLLLIIILSAITLPWTSSYLSTLTSIQDVGRFPLVIQRQLETEDNKVVIGIVACGDKPLKQSIVLLKSIIITSIYHGLSSLDAILFADDDNLHTLDLKVEALKNSTIGIKFRYEIHPVIFPARNHDEWRDLFKPCASQRLFLHSALPHINEILYLDVDTLVVGDIRKVWSKFHSMSSVQAVGLVPEQETSIGWYNRFARHPFYPPYGLNTGVMLMNLTRLRGQIDFDWEKDILNAYKIYKDNISYGDQDLINIVFHRRPDMVFLLPCLFNFRTDHCYYGLCNDATPREGNDIQILHGSRSAFFKEKEFPLFKKLYDKFEKFQIPKNNFVRDIVLPIKRQARGNSNARPTTLNCDNFGHLLFAFGNSLL